MPAPVDRNARIALAKGWTWDEGQWISPDGIRQSRPDYVGTLDGIAGLMRELIEHEKAVGSPYIWRWGWNVRAQRFVCCKRTLQRRVQNQTFASGLEVPGCCVGDAWLGVKEKDSAST